MDYKEKSALGWAIANWLHSHEEFEKDLADNIFFGWKVEQSITEDDLQGMLEKYEKVPFTAADLLRYMNRKNRQEALVKKYSL